MFKLSRRVTQIAVGTAVAVALAVAMRPAATLAADDGFAHGADVVCETTGKYKSAAKDWIRICVRTEWAGTQFTVKSDVSVGTNATSASGCRLIGKASLVNSAGAGWSVPDVKKSCNSALDGAVYSMTTVDSGTSAYMGWGNACIELTFTGSSYVYTRCTAGRAVIQD